MPETMRGIIGGPIEIPKPAPPPLQKTWAPTIFDHLKLQNGKTIGETNNEDLRQQLSKFPIEEIHTAGRETVCRRYGEFLSKAYREAGEKALTELMEKHRA